MNAGEGKGATIDWVGLSATQYPFPTAASATASSVVVAITMRASGTLPPCDELSLSRERAPWRAVKPEPTVAKMLS